MYKLNLILKYLRKRRIAWVSLIAVMLCTAMVLIVISVMGGWLRMFRASFHGLTGDVIVEAQSLTGFPYYQQMIDQIQKLPEVVPGGAVPTIETFGLVNIRNRIRQPVQVLGYPIDKIGNVNDFPQSLHRQWDLQKEKTGKGNPHPTFALHPDIDYSQWAPQGAVDSASHWPGMIVGAAVVGIGRDEHGVVERPEDQVLYTAWVRLSMLQVSPDSSRVDIKSDQRERNYWIVDDSHTGVYQYDSKSIYVPFDVLQQDLDMAAYSYTDDTNQNRISPARTTSIQVKVKPGVDLSLAKAKIQKIVDAIQTQHDIGPEFPIRVQTWEETQAVYLNAIENEKSLVTILFGIISLVAVFLILCIFYMIVMEKTRDIGIIKSVGATSSGVAAIFLGYGLAIGIVGAFLGLLAGYGVVHNINWLHTEFARITGHQIWNPEVYAFDTIPNTMNPPEVIVIMIIAVLASVLGAVVPAIAAARLNPVESLRWE